MKNWQKLLNLFRNYKVQVIEPSSVVKEKGAILMVVRVEDYREDNNDFFKLDENKSYPRKGLVCSKCKYPVVMSNGLWAAYSKQKNPPEVVCIKCINKLPSDFELKVSNKSEGYLAKKQPKKTNPLNQK